jgi:hypothetical protein
MRLVFEISGHASFPAVDGLVPQPQVLDGAQAKIMRYPLGTVAVKAAISMPLTG